MALLDGQAVFGYAVECPPPAINPRRDQKASYPALNGMESLDMGDQGAYTTVTGRLIGANPAAFNTAVALLFSFYDGLVHVLTDNDGINWPNVKVESIEWVGRGEADATLGYTRRYSCRFVHLTIQ